MRGTSRPCPDPPGVSCTESAGEPILRPILLAVPAQPPGVCPRAAAAAALEGRATRGYCRRLNAATVRRRLPSANERNQRRTPGTYLRKLAILPIRNAQAGVAMISR